MNTVRCSIIAAVRGTSYISLRRGGSVGAVEEERVSVEVFDLGGEGNMIERRPRAPPTLE